MELLVIIGIVVVALVFILGLKLFHSLLKAAITAILLLLILAVVGGVIIVNDAADFKESFSENKTTYIMTDNGTVVTGFKAQAMNFTTFQPLSRSELPDSPENVTGERIHIFIERSSLSVTQASRDNMTFDVEQLLDSEDESMQSRGFMMALTTTLMEKGPSFIFKDLQTEKIIIAPQRPSLTMLKYTPKRLWERAEEQFNMKREEFDSKNASSLDNATLVR